MSEVGDNRRMICDCCGEPIKDGDLIYTIANKPEAGTGRHARCHREQQEARKVGMDASLARIRTLLREISRGR